MCESTCAAPPYVTRESATARQDGVHPTGWRHAMKTRPQRWRRQEVATATSTAALAHLRRSCLSRYLKPGPASRTDGAPAAPCMGGTCMSSTHTASGGGIPLVSPGACRWYRSRAPQGLLCSRRVCLCKAGINRPLLVAATGPFVSHSVHKRCNTAGVHVHNLCMVVEQFGAVCYSIEAALHMHPTTSTLV